MKMAIKKVVFVKNIAIHLARKNDRIGVTKRQKKGHAFNSKTACN
jgi:hypothetical protein